MHRPLRLKRTAAPGDLSAQTGRPVDREVGVSLPELLRPRQARLWSLSAFYSDRAPIERPRKKIKITPTAS